MPSLARTRATTFVVAALVLPVTLAAQSVTALPEQTSMIRLSNRDVNHVVCMGGEIEDVKFSAEKAIAVERAGSDAWIKFLVKEVEDMGIVTRSYVTIPSEFFISCNGAIYPLYAEPADIPAQTVTLARGRTQRAAENEKLLGPLVEEERAISITLAVLQGRVPATFMDVAPRAGVITVTALPAVKLIERRRLAVEGAGLSVSEYQLSSDSEAVVEERQFLDRALGSDIFAVTLDRLAVKPGESVRLIVIRRGDEE
ncbi:type-F conjugative transfer system secretin TraK [Sphingopyxis sp. J-6]|uniref:type-F conjugative transfer system secretin TraK n=1 Tax=unclassified Sphingopyxis TaxID=2614943 RepID=UPI00398403E8